MNITLPVILFLLAVLGFLGAWIIAVNGDLFDSTNFNAWLAGGGFFLTAGFLTERAR